MATATAIEQNEMATVLDHMHPDAEEVRSEVRQRLTQFEFSSVVLNKLRVEIDETQSPRTAIASFLAIPKGNYRASQQPIPRQVMANLKVTLVEEDDRWLIRSYELRPTREIFQRRR